MMMMMMYFLATGFIFTLTSALNTIGVISPASVATATLISTELYLKQIKPECSNGYYTSGCFIVVYENQQNSLASPNSKSMQ